jgi:GTP diphosphokinase / guanosine-3',5'-bis(diphosphate) 3'-diphosphatase
MKLNLKKIQDIKTISEAIEELEQQIPLSKSIKDVIEFSISAHEGQFRKSGEPYIVHPILVATLTAYFTKDENIVIAALLHDIIEDTSYNLSFIKNKWNTEVANIVNGLTKFVQIKKEKDSNIEKNDLLLNSALTFRKMIIASIDDIRVLVVKLCDRLHNMLTLEALPTNKQIKISKETLIVYVPIAHRLGISSIKNELEDLVFKYLYQKEYMSIDFFMKQYQNQLKITFNKFINEIKHILEKNGINIDDIEISSRIKHYYSIYLKMQRKGISIDEVLDLQAIRILVKNDLDCYKILGAIHLEYNPLVSRFKDYISIPKENGYQTIHTTVFNNSKIYEIQIRTFNMHKIATYGIAAHWMYKDGILNKSPDLTWLKSLEFKNKNAKEFYNDTKEELFSEDIVVYSPNGDTFTLPKDSTAYDFAFCIHSDIGYKAINCFINKKQNPLLTKLNSGDIISIETSSTKIHRCSWINIVKTRKAKKHINILCTNRKKEINEITGKNIVNTIFVKYNNIINKFPQKDLYKIPSSLQYMKNIKKQLEKSMKKTQNIIQRFSVINRSIKKYKFDNILVYSNFNISNMTFDHCCNPKFGDEIVAFKEMNIAKIHHKMCDKAYSKIKKNHQMLFCQWIKDILYSYKMVISIPSTKGQLAKLLSYMSKYHIYILSINYGRQKDSYIQYCDIEFEINNSNINEVKKIIEKKVKIIEFFYKKDAYNN